ncbi:MAG: hypothetical protein HY855_20275 [Burkholderiales bacterium]|nr:hypothetical protein [Burkholderiales bacterium]
MGDANTTAIEITADSVTLDLNGIALESRLVSGNNRLQNCAGLGLATAGCLGNTLIMNAVARG